MQVAVYVCDVCGFEVYQVIGQRQFNPLLECPADKCKINRTKGQLVMSIRSSKFVSFQDIKIQEPSD
jgi:DNA replication licensing factor MCM7